MYLITWLKLKLQAVMTNKPAQLNDPETWTATAAEIESLACALHAVYEIHKDISHD